MQDTADVCIVGGGVVGLFSALELASAGLNVRIIDKQYNGASKNNIGDALLHAHRDDMHAFMSFTHKAWLETAEEYGRDMGFETRGAAIFALTEDDVTRMKREVELDREHGLETTWISDHKTLEGHFNAQIPEHILGAKLSPQDAIIDTSQSMDALRGALIRKGVKIWGSDIVTDLIMDGDRVIGAKTASGDVCLAKCTLVSAGIWSNYILGKIGLYIPMRPARAHLARVSPTGRVPQQLIVHPEKTGEFLFKYLRTGQVLMSYTGRYDQAQSTWHTDVDQEALNWMIGRMPSFLYGLRYPCVHNAHTVTLAITPDELPIVGPFDGVNGLIVAAGCNGRSYAYAAGLAKVIRNMVEEQEPEIDVSHFSPNRFKNWEQGISTPQPRPAQKLETSLGQDDDVLELTLGDMPDADPEVTMELGAKPAGDPEVTMMVGDRPADDPEVTMTVGDLPAADQEVTMELGEKPSADLEVELIVGEKPEHEEPEITMELGERPEADPEVTMELGEKPVDAAVPTLVMDEDGEGRTSKDRQQNPEVTMEVGDLPEVHEAKLIVHDSIDVEIKRKNPEAILVTEEEGHGLPAKEEEHARFVSDAGADWHAKEEPETHVVSDVGDDWHAKADPEAHVVEEMTKEEWAEKQAAKGARIVRDEPDGLGREKVENPEAKAVYVNTDGEEVARKAHMNDGTTATLVVDESEHKGLGHDETSDHSTVIFEKNDLAEQARLKEEIEHVAAHNKIEAAKASARDKKKKVEIDETVADVLKDIEEKHKKESAEQEVDMEQRVERSRKSIDGAREASRVERQPKSGGAERIRAAKEAAKRQAEEEERARKEAARLQIERAKQAAKEGN